MPEGMNSDAKKQMYLTLVNKGQVLLFNGTVAPSMDDGTVQKYLLGTADSLKISQTPIDVQALRDSIIKSNPK